jgi:hypothetical protein
MLKNYIKKVPILDDRSTPNARGKRLRRIRNLANLSRRDMCDQEDNGLNINTYKGWELGRYGGLPRDGAERVVKRVVKEGVHCDMDWLLHERGPSPQVIPGYIPDEVTANADDHDRRTQELLLFKKHYPHALDFHVHDETMAPHFSPGDIVAGILSEDKNTIDHFVGRHCIVQLVGGKTVLRRVQTNLSNPNSFDLVGLNKQNADSAERVERSAIINIAQVIWHRTKIS